MDRTRPADESSCRSRAWAMAAIGCGATLLAGAPKAAAQDYTYLLLVDYGPGESSVHPGNPSATVRVWATLKDTEHAWAAGNLDIVAGEAGWTEFDLVLGEHGVAGSNRGILSGDLRAVDGVFTAQFNFGLLLAKTDHPILIWEGTWSVASGDFSSRAVGLVTQNTTGYRVYATNTSTSSDRLSQFMPGAGVIMVTPAPGCIALLAWAAGAIVPRRRRVTA